MLASSKEEQKTKFCEPNATEKKQIHILPGAKQKEREQNELRERGKKKW